MPLPQEILETIPEDLRGDETLSRFNDVGALAKSYVEGRRMMGSMIRVPGPDAGEDDINAYHQKLMAKDSKLMVKPNQDDPEQMSAYYKMIGRPDKPEDYTLPEGAKLDEGTEGELRGLAHQIGMSGQQFQDMVTSMSSNAAIIAEKNQEKWDTATAELKSKWGLTFEDRVNAAEKIFAELYPEREFSTAPPPEIEALYKVHEMVTGKRAPVASDDSGATGGMTPEEAHERFNEVMRRVHDPESDLSHSEKLALIKKAQEQLVKYDPQRYAS